MPPDYFSVSSDLPFDFSNPNPAPVEQGIGGLTPNSDFNPDGITPFGLGEIPVFGRFFRKVFSSLFNFLVFCFFLWLIFSVVKSEK